MFKKTLETIRGKRQNFSTFPKKKSLIYFIMQILSVLTRLKCCRLIKGRASVSDYFFYFHLVVTGDSAKIQDETTESSAWSYNVLGV